MQFIQLTMNFPTIICIFMLVVVLSHSSSAQNGSSKLVLDICGQDANCISALYLDPKTKSAADLKTLAQITLQLGMSNATNTKSFVNNLLNDKKTPPSFQEPLKQCSSWHEAAAASFSSAFRELDEDIMTANYDSMIAGDNARICKDVLAKAKAEIPALTARNGYVELYSNIAAKITNRLGG